MFAEFFHFISMGSAMQVLALLVLIFGFAAAQEDVSCPGILDCTETAQVCWSHDSSAYGNTCAELKCDDTGIKLLVRSPKETTKVVLEGKVNMTTADFNQFGKLLIFVIKT